MTKSLQETYAAFDLAKYEFCSALEPYIAHMPLASDYDYLEWDPFFGLKFFGANPKSGYGKFPTFEIYLPPEEGGSKLTVYLEQGTLECVDIPWEGLTPEIVETTVKKALQDMLIRDQRERLIKEAATMEAVRATFGDAACEALWKFHKERRDGV